MKDLTIIVPIYNEAEALPRSLPPLLCFCAGHGVRLILVDDGSEDASPSLIRSLTEKCAFARVARHKLNRGYGAALKTGLRMSDTGLSVFMDADGQHDPEDIARLYARLRRTDADMIVGSRKGGQPENAWRRCGKALIRAVARLLMKVPVHDINSGMKLFRTDLAKRFLPLCPPTMAFADILCLIFLHERCLVLEEPIRFKARAGGHSKANVHAAVNTVYEIFLVLTMFNPMRVFLPVASVSMLAGLAWGSYTVFMGRGVSVGSSLLVIGGLLFFLLGVIAELVSLLRRRDL